MTDNMNLIFELSNLSHLHPLIACAPVLGLISMICFHVVLTRLSRGKMHLFSLILALLVGLFVTEFLAQSGIEHMLFLPGETTLPLYISVGLAFCALGYGYFTFVNLNTTSLRIRLLRELLHSTGHTITAEDLRSRYGAEAIADARFRRLKAWKQIRIHDGIVRLNKHVFWALARILLIIRNFLLPLTQRRLLAEHLISHSQAFREKRILCRSLIFLILVSLAIFYVTGLFLKIERHVTERTSYHAIPVALSQMYKQAPHDYTAFKALAIPFQGGGGGDLLNKIKGLNLAPSERGVYFWLADDRGLSDLVYVSFKLFGTKIKSLYKGYFLLICLSMFFAVITLRNDPYSLSILILFIAAYGSFLPELVTLFGQVMITNYGVNLSESRTFEILGLVLPIQILLTIIRHLRIDIPSLIGIAGQSVIFGFLLSCRSSLGWIPVSLFISTVVLVVYVIYKAPLNSSRPIRSIIWSLIGFVLILTGVQSFKAWHVLAEHPYYLADGGSRTFYHNAVIGLHSNHFLTKTLGVSAPFGDRGAIDSVNEWLKSQGQLENDPVQLLNSLGGHATANWRKYENDAKNFYFAAWKNHPILMIENYYARLLECLDSVIISVVPKVIYLDSSHVGKLITQPSPFSLRWLMIAFVPLFIVGQRVRQTLLFSVCIMPLFVFSLIPGTAFYVATLTTSGAAVLFRLFFYLSAALILVGVLRKVVCFRSLWSPPDSCL